MTPPQTVAGRALLDALRGRRDRRPSPAYQLAEQMIGRVEAEVRADLCRRLVELPTSGYGQVALSAVIRLCREPGE